MDGSLDGLGYGHAVEFKTLDEHAEFLHAGDIGNQGFVMLSINITESCT